MQIILNTLLAASLLHPAIMIAKYSGNVMSAVDVECRRCLVLAVAGCLGACALSIWADSQGGPCGPPGPPSRSAPLRDVAHGNYKKWYTVNRYVYLPHVSDIYLNHLCFPFATKTVY
jgi:hypothetical protein